MDDREKTKDYFSPNINDKANEFKAGNSCTTGSSAGSCCNGNGATSCLSGSSQD